MEVAFLVKNPSCRNSTTLKTCIVAIPKPLTLQFNFQDISLSPILKVGTIFQSFSCLAPKAWGCFKEFGGKLKQRVIISSKDVYKIAQAQISLLIIVMC